MASGLFSDIKIWPVNFNNSNMKANGSVKIANAVEVRFRLIEGRNGMFASLPQREGTVTDKETGEKTKKYFNEVFIEDEDLRQELNDLAAEAYNRVKQSDGSRKNTPSGNGARRPTATAKPSSAVDPADEYDLD